MGHLYRIKRKCDSLLYDHRCNKGSHTMTPKTIRMGRLYSIFAFLLLADLGVFIIGCGSSPSSTSQSNSPSTPLSQSTLTSNPTTPPESTPTSNPTAPSESTPTPVGNTGCTAQPGIICGRLVNRQGNPLANAIVQINGVTQAGGANVQYIPPVGQDGTYSEQVAVGVYQVSAYAQATYQGALWLLPLHPDDNSTRSLPSINGIIKNFTWWLTGTIPDEDPSNFLSHYGAAINVTASGQTLTQDLPQGSHLRFTLTPQGLLVDGSTGQVITFDRIVGVASELDNPFLEDIPLAVYSIAVTGTAPDGSPLSLSVNMPTIVFSKTDFEGGEQDLIVTCSC